jgi:hypothetical protein
MRESAVRGVLIYFSDYGCSHYIAIAALSRASFAQLAASVALTSGRTSIGKKRSDDYGTTRRVRLIG